MAILSQEQIKLLRRRLAKLQAEKDLLEGTLEGIEASHQAEIIDKNVTIQGLRDTIQNLRGRIQDMTGKRIVTIKAVEIIREIQDLLGIPGIDLKPRRIVTLLRDKMALFDSEVPPQ